MYDLSHSQSTDALVITASGWLLPYNSHEHPSQREYYPSIMVVDEMSLMSDCVNIPIRVRRMMDEEAYASPRVSKKLYNSPLTSSTTIYPGSTTYLDLLYDDCGDSQKKSNDATHTETTSKPAATPLFSGPSLKSDNSRRGLKKYFDDTSIFRKRTVNSPDDGFLKKARGFEKSTRETFPASNVSSSNQETKNATLGSSSIQRSHLPRRTNNAKKKTEE